MVVVRDGDIKRAILTALSRRGDPASLCVNTPTVIDAYMADPMLRTNCYNIAIAIAEEDSAKRAPVARMLSSCLVSFPPENSVFSRIEAFCEKYIAKNLEDEPLLRDLLKSVRTFLDPQPIQITVSRSLQPGVEQFTPGEKRSQASAYARYLPTFQPVSDEPVRRLIERERDRVPIPRLTDADCEAIVEEKNFSLKAPRVLFEPTRCKDYIAQTRLSVTKDLLEQQIKALGTYDDSYKTNPSVIRATNFVIKIMCDAYVAKIPLRGDPNVGEYCFLREVSVSFVSIFMKLLESEYLCVRLHVFDTLLTLAVHFQLIDTRNAHKGLMLAMQEELTWLYGRVLEKMARTESIEGVWLAALKSSLATLPPSALCTLDPLVLRQWLFLPGIASCQPHVYAVLSEALALRLIGIRSPMEIGTHVTRGGASNSGHNSKSLLPSSSKRASSCTVVGAPEYHQNTLLEYILSQLGLGSSEGWGDSSTPNPPAILLDEAGIMAALGPNGITELVQFYANSHTVSSRLYFFVILFGIAAWRQHYGLMALSSPYTGGDVGSGTARGSPTGGVPPLSPYHLTRTLRIFVAKSLHWHLQAVVCYQSHILANDIPAMLLGEMDVADVRELRGPLTAMVTAILGLVGPYRNMPDMLTTMLHHTADDFHALCQVVRECCSVIPYMVREDADFSLRRTAGQLVYHLLRLLRSPQHFEQTSAAVGTSDDAVHLLLTTIAGSTVPKVRELAGEVISAFSVLCRTNPQHAKTFLDLTRLAVVKEKNPAHLMTITYAVLESLAVQHGGLMRDGDVFSLSAQGELRLVVKTAEILGSSLFWLLYWGLRHSQYFSVQRARFILLSILAALPPPKSSSSPSSQIALWVRCMSDPSPQAAYTASQQIVRIAAVGCHKIYERVIDEMQAVDPRLVSNPYAMATCIWEFVEAENKVIVD